jgi:hypothetical protein
MANQYKNKIIYGGDVLIDLTGDTVTAATLLSGAKAHDKSGAPITGTCAFDADTSDATAVAAEILATKTAYVNGNKITGTMPNNGAVSGKITSKAGYTIPQGYHDGSGTVTLDNASDSALVANNIREGVEILGITGTMSGSEGMKPQSKTVTPSTTAQTILPDSPTYNCLSQVTVSAIPYVETDNAAGGVTVTIAG